MSAAVPAGEADVIVAAYFDRLSAPTERRRMSPSASTDALADWLAARAGTPIVSSELAKVEVIRACRRINPATLPEATALLASLDLVPLSGTVIDEAANVGRSDVAEP